MDVDEKLQVELLKTKYEVNNLTLLKLMSPKIKARRRKILEEEAKEKTLDIASSSGGSDAEDADIYITARQRKKEQVIKNFG